MNPNLSEKIELAIENQLIIQFEEDIFHAFITENPQELEIVKLCQSQLKSVCGGYIQEGELTFQCFDCAPDPHHMFCWQCFIPTKHKDHKVIFRHNIGGCCDCGDDSTMKKSAFCPKHQGFESVSREQEQAKVPLELQKKIEQFIKVMSKYYLNLMEQVLPFIYNFDTSILKLYHICLISNFQEMKLKIEEMTQNSIQTHYNKFKKVIYIHSLLFRLIKWLIQDKMAFIYLTTSILLQKVDENSTQCIFADIMDKQVYLEQFSPHEITSLEGILFELHADPEFKKYTQAYFLENYERLWLIYSKQDNPYTVPINEIIQQLKTIPPHKLSQVQNNPKIKEHFPLLIGKYFQFKKQQPYSKREFQRAEFHEHHTQYISENYQENLFNDPNFINIYKINAKLLDELTQNLSDTGFMTLSCIYIFKLRFEYSFFSKIIQRCLKTILKDNFDKFLNTQICDPQFLASFPYDQFLLTNLIKSFEGNLPANYQLTQEVQEIEMKSLYYYAAIQAQTVGIFKSGFNQLISQNSDSYLCENLSKVFLFQCFNSIKDHRNKVIEQDINFAIKQLVKGHANQRVQQMRLNYLQFKNAAILDRLLIFYLTYEFCKGEFKDSQYFRNYLTQLFNCDINQIQDVFLPILKRCLQSLCCIIFGVDKIIEELYNGFQQIAQNEVLESYDFSFIKLYIFIFGSETINIIGDQLKQLCIPEYNDTIIYIMLRLCVIEGNFYNVCGSMFPDKLPRDLLYELQVIMGNIFFMKTFHNYKDIENQISSLPLNKERMPKHIIQICELDPSVKQLKLKTFVQQRYDPSLFVNSAHLNSIIVERLLERKDFNLSLLNGNGMDKDITLFNTTHMSVVKQQILKLISTESNIQLLEEIIFAQDSSIKTAFKLYFTQLQAFQTFQPQIYESVAETILNKLKIKLQGLTGLQQEDTKQIQEIISWMSPKIQIQQTEQIEVAQQQKNNYKINNFKVKYQNKNKQFQDSAQFLEINETIKCIDQNEEVCCGCKQSINDNQEACQPLLIQGNTISEFYSPFSETLRQALITDQHNYTQLSISNCRHSFHKSCLLEASKQREIEQNYLPIWVILGCSICKQSFNMTIPILNGQTKQSIEEFNSWLINQQEDFGIQKYLLEHYGNYKNQIYADIYIQLFVNLINQLIIDPKEYLRNEKQKIFQNLLKIALKQFVNYELTLKPLQGNEFLVYIVNSLIIHVMKSKQHDDILIKQEFHQNLLPIALKMDHQNKNEFIQALCLSFDVINEKIAIELQNSSNQISIQKNISQKLILNIGYQFTEFYYKYFTKCCDLCKFYPMHETDEQYLCLLCLKVYCIQFCDITKMTSKQFLQPIGNLNKHVQDCHKGNSLFLSIQKGTILLLSSPISILSYKCLYYDNLGQKLDTQDYNADWKQFHMDEQCISHLSEIILFNQYKSIIRNYEVQQAQLDTNGRI